MMLYARSDDPAGHAIRFVLAEKGVSAQLTEVESDSPPEDLLNLNPYGTLPTLSSREVTLHDTRVILEYLDERYPHPPLMPAEPIIRARLRLLMGEIVEHWYPLADRILTGDSRARSKARKELAELIMTSDELFGMDIWLMNSDFSLADCVVAALLWRLRHLGVKMPAQAKAVRAYMPRVFKRPAFSASLTSAEREMVA